MTPSPHRARRGQPPPRAALALAGLLVALTVAGLLAAPRSVASPPLGCAAELDDCVAVGHWNFSVGLGAGLRTNPLLHGDDIPLVVVPHVSYYGERFFLDDLDVGASLIETSHQTLSLVASPGYDRVYFYRSDLQNFFITNAAEPALGGFVQHDGVQYTQDSGAALLAGAKEIPSHPRRITYLAGPEWTFEADGITGQVDVLHDITGQDHGTEVRTALGIPLVRSQGTLSMNVGLTWKSASIVNYYYGWPSVYQGGSALDPFVKVGYLKPLARHWRFNTFVEVEHLANAIADSPLVANHNVATMFVGAIYTF